MPDQFLLSIHDEALYVPIKRRIVFLSVDDSLTIKAVVVLARSAPSGGDPLRINGTTARASGSGIGDEANGSFSILFERIDMIRKFLASACGATSDRQGMTAAEYAILVVGVIIVVGAAVTTFGTDLTTAFQRIGTQIGATQTTIH